MQSGTRYQGCARFEMPSLAISNLGDGFRYREQALLGGHASDAEH
jgi:hypothetical protein